MSTNRITQIRVILLLLVGMVSSPAVTATTVSIQPPSSTHSVGDSFSLGINISDVTDLYAFQFDIGFSPSILEVTGINEGTFLSGSGTTNYIPGIIDNTAGTVTFIADTLQDIIPGVTGSGTLATIDFNALDIGRTSMVSLSNVVLLDSNINDISASIKNGNITINPAVIPAPEPATIAIFSLGLVGMSWVRHRRLA